MLDLLRKTSLNQEQLGLVNCMEIGANALICLVSNVLDQSRLEAGMVNIHLLMRANKKSLSNFLNYYIFLGYS